MPIPGIEQPERLDIDETLRLRRFDGGFDFAFDWYQDSETVRLVDGRPGRYDREQLERMYRWLDGKGELYFIERREDGSWRPVGDVSFWQTDMPIVIGDKDCRGKGIGKKVVSRLIERGRELAYPEIFVNEIYDFNTGSIALFQSCGFVPCGETEKGKRYRRPL